MSQCRLRHHDKYHILVGEVHAEGLCLDGRGAESVRNVIRAKAALSK